MARRNHSRRTARQSNRTHRLADQSGSFTGRSLYHRKLRLEPLEDRRLLAVVTVTTLSDTVDFIDGQTSLREAIFAANIVPGADTINFAPSLTSAGPAKILLTGGELAITDALTVDGPGATLLTIDAQQQSRIFDITATTGDDTFAGLMLTGGKTQNSYLAGGDGGAIRSHLTGVLSVDQCIVSGNDTGAFGGAGGGVFANGNVSLLQSTISGNRSAGRGGGVFTFGDITAVGSTVSNNSVSSHYGGGGIYAKGSVSLTDCSVTGNSASGSHFNGGGGGILANSNISLVGSHVTGNTASYGGGIFTRGTVSIDDSTISGNTATDGDGGGLYARHVILNASTVSDNTAASSGGGISAGPRGFRRIRGDVTVTNSAITGNTVLGFGIYHPAGGGIYSNGSVTVSGSTLTGNSVINGINIVGPGGGAVYSNGLMTLTDCTISSNSGGAQGGGVSSYSPVVLTRCVVSHNNAEYGGGVSSRADITVNDSVISENSVSRFFAAVGGGIATAYNVTLNHSAVTDNTATFITSGYAEGGGVRAGSLVVNDSEISGNSAIGSPGFGRGGGMNANTVTISRSTIANNESNSYGGGIYARNSVTISSSTISGNSATQSGGGVWLANGAATIAYSTISINRGGGAGGGIIVGGGTLELNHSIVAQNVASLGRDATLLGGTVTAHYSFIGSSAGTGLAAASIGSPDANGNLIGGTFFYQSIDPKLGPLVYNGGPVFLDGSRLLTQALLAGSPAIDAGDPAAVAGLGSVPANDERGTPFGRVVGGRIDMGAVESQPNPLPGDYNFNGIVDAADYTVWADTRESNTDLRADGCGDGVVDQLDYDLWKANFGNTLSATGSAASAEALQLTQSLDTDSGLVEPTLTPASPGPIVVTTLDDTVDFNDGLTSLREAIFAANIVPGADTIDFAPALTAAGPTKILLTGGELAITDSLTINGPGADLLTIDAQQQSRIFNITATAGDYTFDGLTLTNGRATGVEPPFLQNALAGGAIRSLTTGQLSIDGCSVVGNSAIDAVEGNGGGIWATSSLSILNSTVSGNRAGHAGGGIWIDGNSLTLTQSVVEENEAQGAGGGLYQDPFHAGSITLNHSSIDRNVAALGGGGIFTGGMVLSTDSSLVGNMSTGFRDGGGIRASGDVTLIRSVASGNSAVLRGGGVFSDANVSVGESVVSDNQAHFGAGISGHNVSLDHSVVSGNTASGKFAAAGAVNSYGNVLLESSTVSGNNVSGANSIGGAIAAGTVTANNSTVSENTASGFNARVGGIDAKSVVLSNSTVTGNHADFAPGGLSTYHLTSARSIVAGNTADVFNPDLQLLGSNSSAQLSFSLIGSNSGTPLVEAPVASPDANGNLIGGPVHGAIDPKVGPLVNNGGFTLPDGSHILTQALLPGSPAINAGDPSALPGVNGMPAFDERGTPFGRLFGGRIDIGAVEYQPNPLPGDFNFDGVVDAADYTVWRDTLGSTTDLRADATGTGGVNQLDYEVWKENFGSTLATGGAPSAFVDQNESPAPTVASSPQSQSEPIELTTALLPQSAFSPRSSSQPRGDALRIAQPSRDDALLLWLTAQDAGRTSQPQVGTDTARRSERGTKGATSALDDVFAALKAEI